MNLSSVRANTVSQFVGRLVSSATGFIVAIILARQFGVVPYGDFVKVTSYVALFYLVSDFGFNAIFLQRHTQWKILVGLRFAWSLLLMFVAIALLAFIPQKMDFGFTPLVRLGVILFVPTIFLQAMITSANAIFQKESRYDRATLALFAGSLVTVLGLVLSTIPPLSSTGMIGTLLIVSLGTLVTAVCAIVFTKRYVTFDIAFSFSEMASLFAGALPLGLTLLFNLVYFRFDSLLLSLTRPTVEVGLYGFAYKFFEFAIAIPTFYMNAVYPRLLRIEDRGSRIEDRLKRSFWFLVFSSLFLVVLMWFVSPALVWVRPEFAGSVGALRVLSLGLPFFFCSALTMWTLVARGKQAHLLWIYASSMAINILLNIWLVPIFGYMASAWVTVFSEGVVLLLSGAILLRDMRRAQEEETI